jgi:hypothetical protein
VLVRSARSFGTHPGRGRIALLLHGKRLALRGNYVRGQSVRYGVDQTTRWAHQRSWNDQN